MDLRFANDTTLTIEGGKCMEHQLSTTNEESFKIGLKVHKGKKIMINIHTTDIQIYMTEIEKVTNRKSLGQTIAMENRTRQKVSIRMKAGWSNLETTEKSFRTCTLQ